MMKNYQVVTQPGSGHPVNNPVDVRLAHKSMLLALDGAVDQVNTPAHAREIWLSAGLVHWKHRLEEGRVIMVSGDRENTVRQGAKEAPGHIIRLRPSVMRYVTAKQREVGTNVRRTMDSRQNA